MSTKTGTAANYAALLDELDAFLCTTGHAWGLTYAGTGTGRLTGYLGTATTATETITVTATSATSFTVVGTVSGSLGTATVGTPFASSVISFTITAGGTAFVAGDVFQLNTGPKWTRLRYGGCIESIYRTANFSNVDRLFDNTFNTTSTMTTTTVFPATVTVQMHKATEVRAFSIWNGNSIANSPAAFGLQWSDNGTSWTTAQSWSGQTWTQTYQRRDFVLAASAGAHLYWRLNITAANAATLNLTEVRLFADATLKWDVSSRFEYAWEAPGVDGSQEIYVAGYTVTENGADRYNLGFRGFRYWVDPASSVIDVPNNSQDKFLLLSKTPTAYWIVVNGGRFVIATRTSSVYEFAYCGFGLPYETPSAHPYPMLIGAPHTDNTKRWDASNDGGYRNPSDPGAQSPTDGSNTTLAAYMPDASWLQISNRLQGTASEGNSMSGSDTRGRTWPYALSDTGAVQTDHLRDCIDGTKPLLPVVVMRINGQQHMWGEFDGVYWTTGFATSAEALIRDGAIDHLIVPNVNRSSINSFCAIALD
jgi:hypothetical protein